MTRTVTFDPPNSSVPTQATPGSREKLQVMADRYQRGQPLHHPSDKTFVILAPHESISAFFDELARMSMGPIRGLRVISKTIE